MSKKWPFLAPIHSGAGDRPQLGPKLDHEMRAVEKHCGLWVLDYKARNHIPPHSSFQKRTPMMRVIPNSMDANSGYLLLRGPGWLNSSPMISTSETYRNEPAARDSMMAYACEIKLMCVWSCAQWSRHKVGICTYLGKDGVVAVEVVGEKDASGDTERRHERVHEEDADPPSAWHAVLDKASAECKGFDPLVRGESYDEDHRPFGVGANAQ